VLTSSFAGFCRYEREQAWTWEHQALTRARFVAGDASLGAKFEAERESILRLVRDPAALKRDVVDMRRRMLAGTSESIGAVRSQARCGRHGRRRVLGPVPDPRARARACGADAQRRQHRAPGRRCRVGLVPAATAQGAADAYREYRRLQHKIRLTGAPHARVNGDEQSERRAVVGALWKHVFGEPWR
jgi:glutamate-ammonia-ligase adenylyltransferase